MIDLSGPLGPILRYLEKEQPTLSEEQISELAINISGRSVVKTYHNYPGSVMVLPRHTKQFRFIQNLHLMCFNNNEAYKLAYKNWVEFARPDRGRQPTMTLQECLDEYVGEKVEIVETRLDPLLGYSKAIRTKDHGCFITVQLAGHEITVHDEFELEKGQTLESLESSQKAMSDLTNWNLSM